MRRSRACRLGVVLTMAAGSAPVGPGTRSAICRFDQHSSGLAHEVNSSAHAPSKLSPLMRSSSSLDNKYAIAPFGQVMRRCDGSWFGRLHGGDTRSSVSVWSRRRVSAVGPIRPMQPRRPASTSARTHSAALRVFPLPRPPKSSHVRQAPGGGSWSGRAQIGQAYSRPSSSAGDRLASNLRRSVSGSAASVRANSRAAPSGGRRVASVFN
jgi:hypothetical protein